MTQEEGLGSILSSLMAHHGLEVPGPVELPDIAYPVCTKLEGEIFQAKGRYIILTITYDGMRVSAYYRPIRSDEDGVFPNKRIPYVRIAYEDMPRISGWFGMFNNYGIFSEILVTAEALHKLIALADEHSISYEYSNGREIVQVKRSYPEFLFKEPAEK